jgi:uncharacterized protein (DUF983 family)
MKKGTKLYSILKFKCPQCHEGELFTNRNPYRLKGFFDMPERCKVCQLKYEMETGFFYGGMYVSYGLSIAISVAMWIALNTFTTVSMVEFLVIDLSLLVLLTPYVFKLSRAIWINFFVAFSERTPTKLP